MRSPWKMFNKAQGQELIDNTTSTWTTINGINGRKFINKSDSNKYILLRATGIWSNTTHNSSNESGNYWTTTWYSSYYVWDLRFNSSGVLMREMGARYYGFPIRPIK